MRTSLEIGAFCEDVYYRKIISIVLAKVSPCFLAEIHLSFPPFSQPSHKSPITRDCVLGCPCNPTPPAGQNLDENSNIPGF